MMRAVLDANVLVSGFAGTRQPDSIPGRLIRLWQQGVFELVISDHLHQEVLNTLRQPYFRRRLSPAQRSRAAALLRFQCTRVSISAEVTGVATHAVDDLVLAAALSAHTDCLVTGDEALRQRVPEYQGVRIVSPHEFLDLLQAEGGTP